MLVSGVLVALLIAPAFAQRDPFRPLIKPETGTSSGATIPSTPGEPAPVAPAGALPVTGMDVLPPLILGLSFIAAGSALLGLSRYRPTPRGA